MIEQIPIEYLEPNPFQYRSFTDEDLEDLIESIREHGFIGHLEARPARPHPQDPTRSEGKYQLVDGARRLEAAKRAGLTKLPIKRVWRDDTEMEILCYLTNSTMRPPTYWEEAHYFKRLQDHGWSIRQIARAVHKSAGYIQRRLDVLRNSDEEILAAAREGRIDLAAAAMFPYIEPEQRKAVFAKLQQGVITATDMRTFHRLTPEVRDDGTPVITVPLEAQQADEPLPEHDRTRTSVMPIRTVFEQKTPAEHAVLLLVQMRAVVDNLEDRLAKADISTLPTDKLAELRQLARRLRAFAVQLL